MTTEIQQQLLQNGQKQSQNSSMPSSTPNTKDHFQLNLSNKANRLKERFEQGLIDNNSTDCSDAISGDGDDDCHQPAMSKLEQLRQEKLEDLSVFAEGEIKAREARSLFQQIDRRLSAANNGSRGSLSSPSTRSLASMSSRVHSKITSPLSNSNISNNSIASPDTGSASAVASSTMTATTVDHQQQQPIRLTNNVRTC